jgi:hypothetical protein
MLYQEPAKRWPLRPRRFWLQLRKWLPQRAHPVSDIRELSPYLRADIGAGDGMPITRRGQ